jgi:CubicO group peptidase (beta-lactamase class C family)
VASVTKSIMTTLIAIAADQGKLTLDAPLVSFFPERTIANRDARKEQITVRHLASMANGLESLCFANDEGTLREMQTTPDWVQFALDRKMSYAPGTHFCYDSPGMHLLSAILQQASGMTALDFARQNLFEPLGIDEVIWPSDPQGFNHGWGDLYLHHHDMAKIGYLWLNQGVWEGKQIVSRAWVEESVKPQINIDEEDDYGYGWWVPTSGGTYKASGRGGQVINVAPALNALVVTTGGGFEYDEIDPFLIAALVDPSKALPANPTGVAQLNAALTAVVQPPPPTAVAPLPATAQTITGKTFVFAPNPTQMETMRIEFDDTAEASLHITYAGSDQMVTWPVGLDGVYHFFTGKYDLPQGLRGTWVDEQTFVCEYDNIANNDHAQLRFHFDGDRVAVEVQETAHELGVQFEGKLQEP